MLYLAAQVGIGKPNVIVVIFEKIRPVSHVEQSKCYRKEQTSIFVNSLENILLPIANSE
jgi:hypothetical protein